MTTNRASFIEQDCTFKHEGRKFESGGAVVSEQFITAYLGKDLSPSGLAKNLTDWHGNVIGSYRILSSWPIRSYISNRMHSVACYVNGVRYVGRSCGEGMSINAKRSPNQSR